MIPFIPKRNYFNKEVLYSQGITENTTYRSQSGQPRTEVLEEDNLDEFPEILETTNKKPAVKDTPINKPETRSMRLPTVNVQSLQEKLEKLEQSVAAMRKRRTGIVSGTKEFQQFLNELAPS